MNCPTCKKHDEFVFEENIKVWRCDRCHERFIIKPRGTNCDASEKFIRIATTNADRIRSMSDEELAVWLVGATVCERVCDEDEYCHGNECVKRVTRWLKQPAKEEHNETD